MILRCVVISFSARTTAVACPCACCRSSACSCCWGVRAVFESDRASAVSAAGAAALGVTSGGSSCTLAVLLAAEDFLTRARGGRWRSGTSSPTKE